MHPMNASNTEYLSDLPVLLSIAGHDPTGGAGIQADLETAAALGVHCASLISCLTVQDSGNVARLAPIAAELIAQQLDLLLTDLPVDGCKIGLLGSPETARLLADRVASGKLPPLVLDPILAAGGGTALATQALIDTIKLALFPFTRLLTPNLPEACILSGRRTASDAAAALCDLGCEQVLITGGHEPGNTLRNQLYGPQGLLEEWHWPRLPGNYHGSGCTLASACAALLAKGVPLLAALDEAQRFTWHSLASARRIGRQQLFPNRFHAQ